MYMYVYISHDIYREREDIYTYTIYLGLYMYISDDIYRERKRERGRSPFDPFPSNGGLPDIAAVYGWVHSPA